MKGSTARADEPRVSVVMPVFNGEKFLGQAIESILHQTYTDFELLIINDGSTDSSLDIAQAYTDPRVRIINNDRNRGLINTLNLGLGLAQGGYIARMDSDDLASPGRFAIQVEFLDLHSEIAVVGTWVNLIDDGDNVFSLWRMPTDSYAIREALLESCWLCHPSVMFRKKAVLAVGGYNPAALHAEDYDLWLRMSERYLLANIPQPLLGYRMHTEQVSIKKISAQRKMADRCRLASIERRRKLKILTENSRVELPGIWQRLTAAPTTLGDDYMKWINLYNRMKRPGKADELALSAIWHSPFSRKIQRAFYRASKNMLLTPEQLRAFRWYRHKLRALVSKIIPI